MEILKSMKVWVAKAIDKDTAYGFNVNKGLKAIGLTDQRETTLVWSKSTGRPLYNAIVWIDARTSSICKRLEKKLSNGRKHFGETLLYSVCLNQFVWMYCSRGWFVMDEVCLVALS